MRITSTGSRVLRFIKKDLKKRWRDGGGRKERKGKWKRRRRGLTVTEIWADMKAKGQWVLKNMKDKDGKQDGFWGKRGNRGEQ